MFSRSCNIAVPLEFDQQPLYEHKATETPDLDVAREAAAKQEILADTAGEIEGRRLPYEAVRVQRDASGEPRDGLGL